jgi:hypothetical protein
MSAALGAIKTDLAMQGVKPRDVVSTKRRVMLCDALIISNPLTWFPIVMTQILHLKLR